MEKEFRRHSEKGFSLLEIVMVMVISGILMTSVLGTVVLFSQGLTNALSHINAMQDIRNMYTTLQVDMANVPYGNVNSVSTTSFSFKRSDGTNVNYMISGNKLLRNGATINKMDLTGAFEFFDDEGNSTMATADVARVGLRMEMTNPKSGKNYKLYETFALR